MKRSFNLVGTGIFAICLIGILVLYLSFAPNFGASTLANSELPAINCKTILVSPPENTQSIHMNSVITMPDGQVVYLIPSDGDSMESAIIHVHADNTIRNLGTAHIAQGVYGFPQWIYMPEQERIYYLSMSQDAGTISYGTGFIDLNTGQIQTLMQGVNGFAFGEFEQYVWWGGLDAPMTILLNSQSNERSYLDFSQLSEALMPPIPVLALANNELILTDSIRFYRANLNTMQSQALHQDSFIDNSYTNLVLENSLVYINNDAQLKEIDFAGNVLHSFDLQGAGIYSHLSPVGNGYVYTFYDGSTTDLTYLSSTGQRIRFNPEDTMSYSSPIYLVVLKDSQGQETIWFNILDPNNNDVGTLFAYGIENDAPVERFRQDNLTRFEIDSIDDTLIVKSGEDAILFSTDSFEAIATVGDYYGERLFSADRTKIYYRAGQTIEVYDFAANSHQTFFTSEFESPRPLFVDEAKNLLYISERQSSNEDPLGTWNIYAIDLSNAAALRLNSPDIPIPVDTHARGFYTTAAQEILFFNSDYTAVYRISCQS